VAEGGAAPQDRSAADEPVPAPPGAPRRARAANPVELDRIIHERVRLAIVSALAGTDSLSFSELKSALDTSDGNLSVHARRLEDAGYIACHKSFEGRVPRTEYALTPAGRRALQSYVEHMEALIRRVREP
jgi:DNA-binding transcriptional ArsR family regulator